VFAVVGFGYSLSSKYVMGGERLRGEEEGEKKSKLTPSEFF
jgi:hypothetical protein